MNYHPRINDATTAHLSGPQRTPELKATLQVQFMGQAGATAADFERLYPRLRDEHLMRQSDAGMMQARSRMRI